MAIVRSLASSSRGHWTFAPCVVRPLLHDTSKMSYRRPERGHPQFNGEREGPGHHTYQNRRHDYVPRRDGDAHYGSTYPHPTPFDHHYPAPPPALSYPLGPYGARRSPPRTLPPFPPSFPVQQRGYHSNSPSRGGSPGPQRSDGRYVPPHLRGSTPEPSTAPSSGPASPSFRGGRKEPTPHVPTLPPQEYLELSRPVAKSALPSSSIIPKLLVLDLNGALIYRSGSRSTERTIYPRPYLGNFLEYLFGPQPDVPVHADFDSDSRPWEVFVWSSAQPHNVRAMVETGFGRKWIEGVFDDRSDRTSAGEKGEGRLLGVWARDKMDLSSNDYNRKVQTFKDLRKVLTHLAEPETGSSRPPRVFDEKRVLLLDDSPLKAVNQPWNQLVVPEFDIKEFQASKEATRLDDPLAEGSGMDRALLAVIGILDEMRTVGNIPAWVRGGGLMANQKDDIDSAVSRLSVDRDIEVTLEDLPSHESFQHWHNVPSILQYWVDKGVKALESRGIEVDHGLDNAGRSMHARPAHTRADSPPGHYPTAYQNTRRAWSPSAPSSPTQGGVRSPSPDRSSRAGTPKQSDSHRRQFSSETRPSADDCQPWAFDNEPPSRTDLTQRAETDGALQPASRLHVPRGVRTDSWRTWKASDVSAYLVHVADCASTLFHQQDQEAIRTAAYVLSRHATKVDQVGFDEREDKGELVKTASISVGGEGEGAGMEGSSGVKRTRTKGRSEKRSGKKRIKTYNDLGESVRRSTRRSIATPARQAEGAPLVHGGQPDPTSDKPTSETSRIMSQPVGPLRATGATVSEAILSETNGWAPSPGSISRIVKKLDTQTLQELGPSRKQSAHRPLPNNRPADISPSLWGRIREVSDETKSKKKSWGLPMRKNIVHVAMYREHMSAIGLGATKDGSVGDTVGEKDVEAHKKPSRVQVG